MKALLIGLLALLPSMSFAAFAPGDVDLVVVKKSSYSLTLYKNGQEVKKYWIALGPAPKGHKRKQGDQRTPEGHYVLDYKKTNSNFYKAIHVSYPNFADSQAALARGEDPGGMIMIHGQRNGIGNVRVQPSNWTDGCIAMLNHELDEIWPAIVLGTPIEILP
ncbi:MAG: L,D-transpeptidase family protein [Aeromonas sp.]